MIIRDYTQLVEAWLQIPAMVRVGSEALRRRFDVRLIGTEPDIATIEMVAVASRDKLQFDRILISLSRTTLLPSRLVVRSAGLKERMEFRFISVEPNKAINNAYFSSSAIPSWLES